MAARDPVIVGVAETPLEDGKVADGASALQIQAWAAKAALDEAGLGFAEVDKYTCVSLPLIVPDNELADFLVEL